MRAGVEPPAEALAGSMQQGRKWIYSLAGAQRTVNAIGFLPHI